MQCGRSLFILALVVTNAPVDQWPCMLLVFQYKRGMHLVQLPLCSNSHGRTKTEHIYI